MTTGCKHKGEPLAALYFCVGPLLDCTILRDLYYFLLFYTFTLLYSLFQYFYLVTSVTSLLCRLQTALKSKVTHILNESILTAIR